MLRNVLFITIDGGITLFTKEFVNPLDRLSIVGPLILAIIRQAANKTGHRVAFIELQNVAVTIVSDDSIKLACVLFHDIEDGNEFGKLIASELLLAFSKQMGTKNLSSLNGTAKSQQFHSRIPDVFRNSVKPILEKLSQDRGIKNVFLVSDGQVISTASSASMDQLAVVANIKVLISHSTDLMNSASDFPNSLYLEGDSTNIQIIQTDQLTHLVVLCRNNVNKKETAKEVQRSVELLRKVYSLISMVTDRF